MKKQMFVVNRIVFILCFSFIFYAQSCYAVYEISRFENSLDDCCYDMCLAAKTLKKIKKEIKKCCHSAKKTNTTINNINTTVNNIENTTNDIYNTVNNINNTTNDIQHTV